MSELIVISAIALLLTFQCLLAEKDYWLLAILIGIGMIIGVQFLGIFNLLVFVKDNPLQSIIYFIGYIIVGVVWSLIKWARFLFLFRDKIRSEKAKWYLHKFNNANYNEDLTDSEANELYNHFRFFSFKDNPLNIKPLASRNREKICAWIVYWPFSIVLTVLNDPLEKFISGIFNTCKKSYQKLSDHILRDEF